MSGKNCIPDCRMRRPISKTADPKNNNRKIGTIRHHFLKDRSARPRNILDGKHCANIPNKIRLAFRYPVYCTQIPRPKFSPPLPAACKKLAVQEIPSPDPLNDKMDWVGHYL